MSAAPMSDDDLRQWGIDIDMIAASLAGDVPFLTKMIMAQDTLSARRWHKAVIAGTVPATKAVTLTGSYARLDLALTLVEEGFLSRGWLIVNLPGLWRGSDPDDTDPRFLALWHEARDARGSYVRDGVALPRRHRLTVYRGQMPDDKIGIAWSLSPHIALQFARGASLRVPTTNGVVFTRMVWRDDVLAYLTGRGEDEVIIDPEALR